MNGIKLVYGLIYANANANTVGTANIIMNGIAVLAMSSWFVTSARCKTQVVCPPSNSTKARNIRKNENAPNSTDSRSNDNMMNIEHRD
mmetsp:Transcript_5281/g.7733  ORF Transcript_5281/g.7733 Transcript_5281/m.7733 type:complete len:88 (+) Transcript_5281:17-280(+)